MSFALGSTNILPWDISLEVIGYEKKYQVESQRKLAYSLWMQHAAQQHWCDVVSGLLEISNTCHPNYKRPQNTKATWCKKNFMYGQKNNNSKFFWVKTSEAPLKYQIFIWAQHQHSFMSYTSSHLPYLEQTLPNEGPDYMDVLFIFLGHMLRTSPTSSQLESMAVFPAIKASHIKRCHAD